MAYKLVILLLFALLTACNPTSISPSPAPSTAVPQSRILSLGDSYTIGQGVKEAERYPVQLAAALNQGGIPAAPPTILARTGWTTDDLLNALESTTLTPPYQLVTVLIGVNDQYGGRSPEDYRSRFRVVLQKAVRLAGDQPLHVLVFSIPDWGATPFGEARDPARTLREINQFNAVNAQEAQLAGVRYLNITPLSRFAGSDVSLVAADGLHYSGKMYAQWVELALPVAQQILRP
jgi:lysophospholipase L1-like esterase